MGAWDNMVREEREITNRINIARAREAEERTAAAAERAARAAEQQAAAANRATRIAEQAARDVAKGIAARKRENTLQAKRAQIQARRKQLQIRRANGEGKITTRIAAILGWCETVLIAVVFSVVQNSWSVFWEFFVTSFVVAVLLYFVKRDAGQFPRGLVLVITMFVSFLLLTAIGDIVNTGTGVMVSIVWIVTLTLMCIPAFRAFGWIGD